MTTITTDATGHRSGAGAHQGAPARTIRSIPMTRLVSVELRKMFDTRAGFWMLASIAILSILATAAAIAFAPDEAITYGTFGSAVGIPMSVILPIIAILAITSEYSQRTGLTTYTLVPHRGRVIFAKALTTALIGVVGMGIALGVGALGNLLGASITGAELTWDMSVGGVAKILLAMVLTMFVGFMLGALLRNSPAAIVSYFVFSLVLPGVFGLLAAFQQWFADLQPWVDLNFATTRLYDTAMTGEDWAQLGVASLIWLIVPLAIGVRLLLRSEVK